jgi:DNA segregation ATPase FtsK/SpoIIIE, S-DNA-T family
MTEEQSSNIKTLTLKLVSLSFPAIFTKLEPGPIVTTYYFKPGPANILAKIMSRTEDLALAVGAESILLHREKDEISIAIPNKEKQLIKFDNSVYWLSQSREAKEMALPLLMGQSTSGENFTLDLATQPHILIAGSTGSGKSVFLSQLLTSLAIQKSPQELKLVLVDTKQLDLTLFKSLEHVDMLVDDIKDLYDVMDVLKAEVRKRTAFMKGLARNIKEYNALKLDPPIPYYVLVIDELADIISLDKELAHEEDKDTKRIRISSSLAQLAQISRAAGIHIIAATQRPSVKIINGDIKTNLPTRICFKLPSGVDSRVVLDENGAENLLGAGDYLYKTALDSTSRRGHSSFVQLSDIARVIEQHQYIRQSFQFLNI